MLIVFAVCHYVDIVDEGLLHLLNLVDIDVLVKNDVGNDEEEGKKHEDSAHKQLSLEVLA